MFGMSKAEQIKDAEIRLVRLENNISIATTTLRNLVTKIEKLEDRSENLEQYRDMDRLRTQAKEYRDNLKALDSGLTSFEGSVNDHMLAMTRKLDVDIDELAFARAGTIVKKILLDPETVVQFISEINKYQLEK